MPTIWPGRDIEADIVQHFPSVDAIAEGDVVETDIAADRRQPRPRRRVKVGSAVVLRMSPSRCDRQPRLVKILPDLRQTQHRRADPAGQHVEGDEFADRQAAFDHEPGAEIQDAGGDDLADELHQLARGVAETEDPKARRYIAGKLLFPAPLHLRFDRHRLERLDPGHALDQKGLVLGAAPEFFVEPPPEQRRHARRDRDVERERAEHDPGQQRRIGEHHAPGTRR